jgi:hypothetical protein
MFYKLKAGLMTVLAESNTEHFFCNNKDETGADIKV